MSIEEVKKLINDLKTADKSKEEIAKDILKSTDASLDEVFWVQTVERDAPFNADKCPYLDEAITVREILLSVLIGKPYPTYILEGITDHKQDKYRNEIVEPKDAKTDYAFFYEKAVAERKNKGKEASDKKGIIRFGYDKSGEEMDGYIEVSENELLNAGLDPEKMGLEDKTKVTSKDIADADKEKGLTTRDMGGIKGFIKRLFEKAKGREGK